MRRTSTLRLTAAAARSPKVRIIGRLIRFAVFCCNTVVVRRGACRVSAVSWARVAFVSTAVTLSVAGTCILTNSYVGRAPGVITVSTFEPVPLRPISALAPSLPGFPDLDGFADVSAGHVGKQPGHLSFGHVYRPSRFAVRDADSLQTRRLTASEQSPASIGQRTRSTPGTKIIQPSTRTRLPPPTNSTGSHWHQARK